MQETCTKAEMLEKDCMFDERIMVSKMEIYYIFEPLFPLFAFKITF